MTGADRFRVFLLAFGLSCIAADVAWLLGHLFLEDSADEGGLLVWVPTLLALPDTETPVMARYLMFFGGLLLAQWFFLRPRRDWRIQLTERGRPMKSAVVVAAIMAALLTIGAIAVLLDVIGPNLWDLVEDTGDRIFGPHDNGPLWTWYAVLLALWCLWAALFHVYWREGERSSQLGRMMTGLVSGSILELFVSIGVHAWDPQENPCWCARGSFLGIVFGATVMIWAFGPGLLLLFWRRRRERSARLAARGRA